MKFKRLLSQLQRYTQQQICNKSRIKENCLVVHCYYSTITLALDQQYRKFPIHKITSRLLKKGASMTKDKLIRRYIYLGRSWYQSFEVRRTLS
jgi:hypothetical protein